MKRLIFVSLAFLFGCSGMGSGPNRFLPAGPAQGVDSAAPAPAAAEMPQARRGPKTKVRLTMTIPRHRRHGTRARGTSRGDLAAHGIREHRHQRRRCARVQRDSGFARVPHWSERNGLHAFSLDAPVGADTFLIATYSGPSAGGAKLDQGSAVFNVLRGKSNTPVVRLGPVVSITADSGVGSLRYAIGAANAGDTIMMVLPSNSTITLASPLTVSNRIAIAGPGVSASARRSHDEHSNATYAGIAISGNNSQQIFSIQAGATVTISGLILDQRQREQRPRRSHRQRGRAHPRRRRIHRQHDDGRYAAGDQSTARERPRAPTPARRAGSPASALQRPYVRRRAAPSYNNATLYVSGTTFDGKQRELGFVELRRGLRRRNLQRPQ